VLGRINTRWLVLSLLALLLAGGGYLGYSRWINRPAHLLASAQAYYDRAEKARAAGDKAGARLNFESADRQLANLLAQPGHAYAVPALMLRYRTLRELSPLVAEEEEAQGALAGRSAELYQQSWVCVERVVGLDPNHAEAHVQVILGQLVRGRTAAAAPFAARLVRLGRGENSDGDWPTYAADQITARFVLAWMALHQAQPPRPEEALELLRQAEGLTAEAPSGERPAAPRWRAVALEGRALALLADQYRQLDADGRSGKTGSDLRDAQERLQTRLAGWLERARAEAAEPLPAEPVTLPTTVHTVASLAVRHSPSDLPGLLDVLSLGVQRAGSPPEVLSRLELNLVVCEKLTSAEKAPELVLQQVSAHLARVADAAHRRINRLVRSEKKVGPNVLRSTGWAGLCDRLERLGERNLERLGGRAADGYLNLARTAQGMGRQAAALRLAQRGLESVAQARKANPDAGDRLATTEDTLHAVAAWAHLAQNNLPAAREQLAAVRKSPDRAPAAYLRLLEGLLALQEGRLDAAARDLEEARQTPAIADTLYPYLGLIHAYMGLGKYDQALANLDRVRQVMVKAPHLRADAQASAEWLLPNEAELNLDYFRCHLGLGHLEQALACKEHLGGLPEGKAATVLLVRACTARPAGADVEPFYQAARRDLAVARMRTPDDPVYAAAEAELLLSRPETNLPLAASAVAALAGPPGNCAAQVVEYVRLQRALAWQVEKAEQVLRDLAMRSPDLSAQLTWARWLALRGRITEADELLRRLETGKDAEDRRRIQLQRTLVLLARGPSPEVAQLLEALGVGGRDLRADLLGVFYAAVVGNRTEADQRLTRAFGRHGSTGMLHYWKGQLAEAAGDLPQAARSYAQALPFTDVRPQAQRSLLQTLIALSATESPRASQQLTAELLKDRPNEPPLLLAAAEAALLLDDFSGMEVKLGALEEALREMHGHAAAGAYFRARAWRAAGRPDLARPEIDRALHLSPRDPWILLLAGELARETADWERCLTLAEVLEEVRPDRPEVLLWRSAALERLGKTAEALRVGQQLVQKFPDRPEGYLGLARLLEADKNYADAVGWVAAWRERAPTDADGLRAHVRLLALTGRTAEALTQAERALQNVHKEAIPAATALQREEDLTLAAALGFFSARAHDEAEQWARQAQAAAGKLPEAARRAALITANLVLAEVHLRRGQQATAAARQKHMDEAIRGYRAVLELAPDHALAGNNLAWLLSQERNAPAEALAVLRQVCQGRYSHQPLSGDRLPLNLLDTMGVVYRSARRNEDAVKLFQEAARRYKEEPRVFLHLARSYAGLQQYREASESLHRAAHLATTQMESTPDRVRKAELLTVLQEVRQDQSKLRPGGSLPQE
jgi:tetratricopeptide (TPR) repeat protein